MNLNALLPSSPVEPGHLQSEVKHKINSTVMSNIRAQVHGVHTISLSVDGLCRFIKLKVNYCETCYILVNLIALLRSSLVEPGHLQSEVKHKINSTVMSNIRAQVHGVHTISLSVDGLCRFIKLKVNYCETC